MISRRVPIPATFIVVVAATIFLIIFFGAWAVSADVSDQERSLSFGFVSTSTSLDASVPDPSGPAGDGALDPEKTGADPEDRWWGQAFLKACPFH